ncbi:unnamed protein product [Clavelina lepadiformis]|uniref:Uncharacterized protein n=1 Tax=Clavelina lepadiformis TaxID=159417 RepID=A0ABP0F6E6_CLALP
MYWPKQSVLLHLCAIVIILFCISKRGDTAADVNECLGKNKCHTTLGICTNYDGGYTCRCKLGYQGNGLTCNDIDECSSATHNCHENATCVNLVGSHDCICKKGFSGNGSPSCWDENECDNGSNNCHENAKCSNTAGSYTCACKSGFVGDGVTTCKAIAKCSTICGTNEECVYDRCVCKIGFELRQPFGKCTASCSALTVESPFGNVTFGSVFVNQKSFSSLQCADGRPMGSIFCSGEENAEKRAAAFDMSTLIYLNCNLTLADYLANMSSRNTNAIEKITGELILLMKNRILAMDETSGVVNFFSNFSAKLDETESKVSLNALSNMIYSADVIASSAKTVNGSNEMELGQTLVHSLHTVVSHVASAEINEMTSIEAENVAVVISSHNSETGLFHNTKYRLNVTANNSLVQVPVVDVTLPSEAYQMVSTSTNGSFLASMLIFKGKGLYHGNLEWVVSAEIGKNVTVANLTKPVTISFSEIQATSGLKPIKESLQMMKTDLSCVYRDETNQKWVTDGLCRMEGSSICQSTHLTSFSILIRHTVVDGNFALSMVSIIGCSLSVIGLICTVLAHLYVRKVREVRQNRIFIHICVSLISFYLAFIFGVGRTENPNVCTAVTSFLHFVLLSAWCWMAVYIHCIYRSLTELLGARQSKHYMLLSCVFAYGGPLLATAATIAVTFTTYHNQGEELTDEAKVCGNHTTEHRMYKSYRPEHLCWLHENALNFGFVLPSFVLLVFNIVLYAMVMRKITGRKNKSTARLKRDVRVGVVMAITLGFTWAFGYFMMLSSEVHFQTIMSWAFAITSSMQGFFLFLLTAVMRLELRNAWYKPIQSGILAPIGSFAYRSLRSLSQRQKTGFYDIHTETYESNTTQASTECSRENGACSETSRVDAHSEIVSRIVRQH